MKSYWIHRISHCWDVSKVLFDKGYLTIGWAKYAADEELINAVKTNGEKGFNAYFETQNDSSRSRWSLYRFLNIKKDDTVIIPLYSGEFAIADVEESCKTIRNLPFDEFLSLNNTLIKNCGNLVYEEEKQEIDLGFYVKIKNIKIIKRAFASSALQSRMKMRQTNGKITDKELKKDIENARVATGPANLHDLIIENTCEEVLSVINQKLTPDQFELLIKWYMKKMGASKVYRPAKNEKNKIEGSDADVVAEFDALGVIFYIQAKQHKKTTNPKAVNQILLYFKQHSCSDDSTAYIPWVISTADNFDQECLKLAREANAQNIPLRLIDKKEFAKMLLEAGISSINDILNEATNSK
jgi:hypothetical protein